MLLHCAIVDPPDFSELTIGVLVEHSSPAGCDEGRSEHVADEHAANAVEDLLLCQAFVHEVFLFIAKINKYIYIFII